MRYVLTYGETHRCSCAFVVFDSMQNRVVLHSDHKGYAIMRAQELNGLYPADGNEDTYGNQLAARGE